MSRCQRLNELHQHSDKSKYGSLRAKRRDKNFATSKETPFRLLYVTHTPEALNRFTVQMQEAPDRWVKELSLRTELTAYLTARAKSKAKMCTYRVVDDATDEVVSTVRCGKALIT